MTRSVGTSFTPQTAATDAGRGSVPVTAGTGLKPCHFADIIATRPALGWFEVHPENYLVAGGPMHHYLTKIRADHPLSFHSVGMSLGSADGIDEVHIQRLKNLCERYEPALVSDHLSWSRHATTYLNDLLPVPCTTAALQLFCDNVDRVQELLGRRISVENPSTYIALAPGDMDEAEFLVEIARRTGAGILLDINNIYVSASNHGWSATSYLARIPSALVTEMHLAGHTREDTADGPLLIDDHGSPVCTEVWALYAQALKLLGPKPTLIEWDTDVPALDVLLAETRQADAFLAAARQEQSSV